MPKWAKVLLIIAAVFVLLLAALVGFGVYLWRQHGPQLIENAQKAGAEAREFGKGKDNQACLEEAVSRHKRAEGFGELIGLSLFLDGCLDVSEPTEGFCDGVPSQTSFIKSAQWQAEQCTKYGLSQEKQCGQIFVQVQKHCDARSGGPQEPSLDTK
jgi:hypothetical protein